MGIFGTLGRKLRGARRLLAAQGLAGLSHRFRDHYWFYWRLRRKLGAEDFVPPPPRLFQVEISGRCNLRCRMCSLSKPGAVPGKVLAPEEFSEFLDKLGLHSGSVAINGIGEPLTNPHLAELLEILENRGVQCSFYTNAMLLDEATRKLLVDSRSVCFVAFSCDSADKGIFEATRRGANFDRFLENVGAFAELARRSRPDLVLSSSTVLSKENLSGISHIIDLAASLGMHKVSFATMYANDPSLDEFAPTPEQYRQLPAAEHEAYAASKGILAQFNLPVAPEAGISCFMPWEYVFVSANGRLNPCCMVVDPELRPDLGNINDVPLAELWSGPGYRAFRQSFLGGTSRICQGCQLYHHPGRRAE